MTYRKTEVTLERGLFVGDQAQPIAEVRESTAQDYIEATRAAERVVYTPEGYLLLSSESEIAIQMLCRRIVKIGELNGPLDVKTLGKLTGNDLESIRVAAETLDAVSLEVALKEGGRSETAGNNATQNGSEAGKST